MLSAEEIGGGRGSTAEFCEKKVLVVEDDPTLAKFWLKLLSGMGFGSSRVVSTVAEALNFLRWHGADLIIVDLCLKELSGIDLARKARQMNPLIKTAITSSSFDTSIPLDTGGFVHLLKKPYKNLEGLKNWMNDVLKESDRIEDVEKNNPGVYVWDI